MLASSLLSRHCCMQFFLEYTFPVMDSSKHHFSQGHNFGLSKVTDLFMCNSNKSSYKYSSFWWVLAKPFATWSCKILWLCLEFMVHERTFHFTVPVKMGIQFPSGHFEHSSRSKPSVTISNLILYRSLQKHFTEEINIIASISRQEILSLSWREDQWYLSPPSQVLSNLSLKSSNKSCRQEIHSVTSVLTSFLITANLDLSDHNVSLLLLVCLAVGFGEPAMHLLSSTIRTHSICCQRLCFSMFLHELVWTLFYWSLHFFMRSAQNRTKYSAVQIFSWSFSEFWIQVKVYFTFSCLYLLIQHLPFPQQHEITGFCGACNSLRSQICSVGMLLMQLFLSLSLLMLMIPVHVTSTCPCWITVFFYYPHPDRSKFVLSSDTLAGPLSLVIVSKF